MANGTAPLKDETASIYLGKNRRLADPIFLPGLHPQVVKDAQKLLEREIDKPPTNEVLPDHIQAFRHWGYGRYSREPVAGLGLGEKLYHLIMAQNTYEVRHFWLNLNNDVTQFEDHLQDLIMDYFSSAKEDQLKNLLEECYSAAQAQFNNATKTWKFPGKIFSHFDLAGTTLPEEHMEDLNRFTMDFIRGDIDFILSRDHYHVKCLGNANFVNMGQGTPRHQEPPKQWDEKGQFYNNNGDREYATKVRAGYLAPHLNLADLLDPVNLLTFIHNRARLQPATFTKLDHDMTYIGRVTKFLTGPIYGNRMVSFECFDTDMALDRVVYTRIWRGWGKEPENPSKRQQHQPEQNPQQYRELFYRGRLYGTSDAWVIVQSQRLTYCFLAHLMDRLMPLAIANSNRLYGDDLTDDQSRAIMEMSLERLEQLKMSRRGGVSWKDARVLKQYQPIPVNLVSDEVQRALLSRAEAAEAHIQQLFNDPEYFFEAVMDLKKHHWANVKLKRKETDPIASEEIHRYLGLYDDKQYRHIIYYDCTRRVMRRAIFEFYIWFTAHQRLLELDQALDQRYPGHKDLLLPLSGQYTDMVDPPMLVNCENVDNKSDILAKYLEVATLIRYYAKFFLYEFRKKAIHTGSDVMNDLSFGIDPLDPGDKSEKCPINRQYYEADDMKLVSRFVTNKPAEGTDQRFQLWAFSLINTHLANEFDSMNTGVLKVTSALRNIMQDEMLNEETGDRKKGKKRKERDEGPEERREGKKRAKTNVEEEEKKRVEEDDDPPLFTPFIANTIDHLDLLASIADQMELQRPVMDILGPPNMNKNKIEEYYKRATTNIALDFLHFDKFTADEAIPRKRMDRIFLFFDEMQGFTKLPSVTLGYACGDLKRMGASLLAKLIIPRNNDCNNKADEEALNRLERHMKVTRFEYPYDKKEKPFNYDQTQAPEGVTVPLRHPGTAYRGEARKAIQKGKDFKGKTFQNFLGISMRGLALREKTPEQNTQQEIRRQLRVARRKDKAARRFELIRQRYIVESSEEGSSSSSSSSAGDQPEVVNNAEDIAVPDEAVDEAAVEAAVEAEDEAEDEAGDEVVVVGIQGQLPLPGVPAHRPRPQPIAPPRPIPSPWAPDGRPRAYLKKRDWDTLSTIYGDSPGSVTWDDMLHVMRNIGYRVVPKKNGGGSHSFFEWTANCRWPRANLPKGNNIQLSKNHEGRRSSAARGKARHWGHTLTERGLDFDFVKDWYTDQRDEPRKDGPSRLNRRGAQYRAAPVIEEEDLYGADDVEMRAEEDVEMG